MVLLECLLCTSNVSHLRHHLRSAHKVLNLEERQTLLRLARGRVKLRDLSCPVCSIKFTLVERHLIRQHSVLTDPVVRNLIKTLKWKVSMDELARLRETNPEIPMASTLDVIESLNLEDQVPAPQDHQVDDSFSVGLPDNKGDYRADASQAEPVKMPETYPEFVTLNLHDLLEMD
ncbi:hypothetical protein PO909_030021 [Leuciscus waleckii]